MNLLHTGEMRNLEATLQLKRLMTANVCQISLQDVVFVYYKERSRQLTLSDCKFFVLWQTPPSVNGLTA
jgi:hypothetical protein